LAKDSTKSDHQSSANQTEIANSEDPTRQTEIENPTSTSIPATICTIKQGIPATTISTTQQGITTTIATIKQGIAATPTILIYFFLFKVVFKVCAFVNIPFVIIFPRHLLN
jgi:hypothetical protein